MTSTDDGKGVKSNSDSSPSVKTLLIQIFKQLEAELNNDGLSLASRLEGVCRVWDNVRTMLAYSADQTHRIFLEWAHKHTAKLVLQADWRDPKNSGYKTTLLQVLEKCIDETSAVSSKLRPNMLGWEEKLVSKANWFKDTQQNPWDHSVLRALFDPLSEQPDDPTVLKWLHQERGSMVVIRLSQLSASKCDDLALNLASAILNRMRKNISEEDQPEVNPKSVSVEDHASWCLSEFGQRLIDEAGFSLTVLDYITDVELVLLHKSDGTERFVQLMKQIPLRNCPKLVERLRERLKACPAEKKLWKNATKVAALIAEMTVARCMVADSCAGPRRTALAACGRALAQLLPADRLSATCYRFAKLAATARHLHTLTDAIDSQIGETRLEMRPLVCELYVRSITVGMNELEQLKLKQFEDEARQTERTVAIWFLQLARHLAGNARVHNECVLTAFSLHPARELYERLERAPHTPHRPAAMPDHAPKDSDASGGSGGDKCNSWANDSRPLTATAFVKTSETLRLRVQAVKCDAVSIDVLEGEGLGLSAELCSDLAVLLSGPRVKTLSWNLEREQLLKNCRTYMERTGGGTKALTTELKYLNLKPSDYQHLPLADEEDEETPFYGIEKGYEHLIEESSDDEPLSKKEGRPDEFIGLSDFETSSAVSSGNDSDYYTISHSKRNVISDGDTDPLGIDPFENVSEHTSGKRNRSKTLRKPSKSKTVLTFCTKKSKQKDISSKKVKKTRTKTKSEFRPMNSTDLAELIIKKKSDLDNPSESLVDQKSKKGKKKKEKKEKKKAKKILKVKKPITDSDYDSQEKYGITSPEPTEGSGVLIDGLYDMDDFTNSDGLRKEAHIKRDPTQSINKDILPSKTSKPNSCIQNTTSKKPSTNKGNTYSAISKELEKELSKSLNLKKLEYETKKKLSNLLAFRKNTNELPSTKTIQSNTQQTNASETEVSDEKMFSQQKSTDPTGNLKSEITSLEAKSCVHTKQPIQLHQRESKNNNAHPITDIKGSKKSFRALPSSDSTSKPRQVHPKLQLLLNNRPELSIMQAKQPVKTECKLASQAKKLNHISNLSQLKKYRPIVNQPKQRSSLVNSQPVLNQSKSLHSLNQPQLLAVNQMKQRELASETKLVVSRKAQPLIASTSQDISSPKPQPAISSIKSQLLNHSRSKTLNTVDTLNLSKSQVSQSSRPEIANQLRVQSVDRQKFQPKTQSSSQSGLVDLLRPQLSRQTKPQDLTMTKSMSQMISQKAIPPKSQQFREPKPPSSNSSNNALMEKSSAALIAQISSNDQIKITPASAVKPKKPNILSNSSNVASAKPLVKHQKPSILPKPSKSKTVDVASTKPNDNANQIKLPKTAHLTENGSVTTSCESSLLSSTSTNLYQSHTKKNNFQIPQTSIGKKVLTASRSDTLNIEQSKQIQHHQSSFEQFIKELRERTNAGATATSEYSQPLNKNGDRNSINSVISNNRVKNTGLVQHSKNLVKKIPADVSNSSNELRFVSPPTTFSRLNYMHKNQMSIIKSVSTTPWDSKERSALNVTPSPDKYINCMPNENSNADKLRKNPRLTSLLSNKISYSRLKPDLKSETSVGTDITNAASENIGTTSGIHIKSRNITRTNNSLSPIDHGSIELKSQNNKFRQAHNKSLSSIDQSDIFESKSHNNKLRQVNNIPTQNMAKVSNPNIQATFYPNATIYTTNNIYLASAIPPKNTPAVIAPSNVILNSPAVNNIIHLNAMPQFVQSNVIQLTPTICQNTNINITNYLNMPSPSSSVSANQRLLDTPSYSSDRYEAKTSYAIANYFPPSATENSTGPTTDKTNSFDNYAVDNFQEKPSLTKSATSEALHKHEQTGITKNINKTDKKSFKSTEYKTDELKEANTIIETIFSPDENNRLKNIEGVKNRQIVKKRPQKNISHDKVYAPKKTNNFQNWESVLDQLLSHRTQKSGKLPVEKVPENDLVQMQHNVQSTSMLNQVQQNTALTNSKSILASQHAEPKQISRDNSISNIDKKTISAIHDTLIDSNISINHPATGKHYLYTAKPSTTSSKLLLLDTKKVLKPIEKLRESHPSSCTSNQEKRVASYFYKEDAKHNAIMDSHSEISTIRYDKLPEDIYLDAEIDKDLIKEIDELFDDEDFDIHTPQVNSDILDDFSFNLNTLANTAVNTVRLVNSDSICNKVTEYDKTNPPPLVDVSKTKTMQSNKAFLSKCRNQQSLDLKMDISRKNKIDENFSCNPVIGHGAISTNIQNICDSIKTNVCSLANSSELCTANSTIAKSYKIQNENPQKSKRIQILSDICFKPAMTTESVSGHGTQAVETPVQDPLTNVTTINQSKIHNEVINNNNKSRKNNDQLNNMKTSYLMNTLAPNVFDSCEHSVDKLPEKTVLKSTQSNQLKENKSIDSQLSNKPTKNLRNEVSVLAQPINVESSKKGFQTSDTSIELKRMRILNRQINYISSMPPIALPYTKVQASKILHIDKSTKSTIKMDVPKVEKDCKQKACKPTSLPHEIINQAVKNSSKLRKSSRTIKKNRKFSPPLMITTNSSKRDTKGLRKEILIDASNPESLLSASNLKDSNSSKIKETKSICKALSPRKLRSSTKKTVAINEFCIHTQDKNDSNQLQQLSQSETDIDLKAMDTVECIIVKEKREQHCQVSSINNLEEVDLEELISSVKITKGTSDLYTTNVLKNSTKEKKLLISDSTLSLNSDLVSQNCATESKDRNKSLLSSYAAMHSTANENNLENNKAKDYSLAVIFESVKKSNVSQNSQTNDVTYETSNSKSDMLSCLKRNKSESQFNEALDSNDEQLIKNCIKDNDPTEKTPQSSEMTLVKICENLLSQNVAINNTVELQNKNIIQLKDTNFESKSIDLNSKKISEKNIYNEKSLGNTRISDKEQVAKSNYLYSEVDSHDGKNILHETEPLKTINTTDNRSLRVFDSDLNVDKCDDDYSLFHQKEYALNALSDEENEQYLITDVSVEELHKADSIDDKHKHKHLKKLHIGKKSNSLEIVTNIGTNNPVNDLIPKSDPLKSIAREMNAKTRDAPSDVKFKENMTQNNMSLHSEIQKDKSVTTDIIQEKRTSFKDNQIKNQNFDKKSGFLEQGTKKPMNTLSSKSHPTTTIASEINAEQRDAPSDVKIKDIITQNNVLPGSQIQTDKSGTTDCIFQENSNTSKGDKQEMLNFEYVEFDKKSDCLELVTSVGTKTPIIYTLASKSSPIPPMATEINSKTSDATSEVMLKENMTQNNISTGSETQTNKAATTDHIMKEDSPTSIFETSADTQAKIDTELDFEKHFKQLTNKILYAGKSLNDNPLSVKDDSNSIENPDDKIKPKPNLISIQPVFPISVSTSKDSQEVNQRKSLRAKARPLAKKCLELKNRNIYQMASGSFKLKEIDLKHWPQLKVMVQRSNLVKEIKCKEADDIIVLSDNEDSEENENIDHVVSIKKTTSQPQTNARFNEIISNTNLRKTLNLHRPIDACDRVKNNIDAILHKELQRIASTVNSNEKDKKCHVESLNNRVENISQSTSEVATSSKEVLRNCDSVNSGQQSSSYKIVLPKTMKAETTRMCERTIKNKLDEILSKNMKQFDLQPLYDNPEIMQKMSNYIENGFKFQIYISKKKQTKGWTVTLSRTDVEINKYHIKSLLPSRPKKDITDSDLVDEVIDLVSDEESAVEKINNFVKPYKHKQTKACSVHLEKCNFEAKVRQLGLKLVSNSKRKFKNSIDSKIAVPCQGASECKEPLAKKSKGPDLVQKIIDVIHTNNETNDNYSSKKCYITDTCESYEQKSINTIASVENVTNLELNTKYLDKSTPKEKKKKSACSNSITSNMKQALVNNEYNAITHENAESNINVFESLVKSFIVPSLASSVLETIKRIMTCNKCNIDNFVKTSHCLCINEMFETECEMQEKAIDKHEEIQQQITKLAKNNAIESDEPKYVETQNQNVFPVKVESETSNTEGSKPVRLLQCSSNIGVIAITSVNNKLDCLRVRHTDKPANKHNITSDLIYQPSSLSYISMQLINTHSLREKVAQEKLHSSISEYVKQLTALPKSVKYESKVLNREDIGKQKKTQQCIVNNEVETNNYQLQLIRTCVKEAMTSCVMLPENITFQHSANVTAYNVSKQQKDTVNTLNNSADSTNTLTDKENNNCDTTRAYEQAKMSLCVMNCLEGNFNALKRPCEIDTGVKISSNTSSILEKYSCLPPELIPPIGELPNNDQDSADNFKPVNPNNYMKSPKILPEPLNSSEKEAIESMNLFGVTKNNCISSEITNAIVKSSSRVNASTDLHTKSIVFKEDCFDYSNNLNKIFDDKANQAAAYVQYFKQSEAMEPASLDSSSASSTLNLIFVKSVEVDKNMIESNIVTFNDKKTDIDTTASDIDTIETPEQISHIKDPTIYCFTKSLDSSIPQNQAICSSNNLERATLTSSDSLSANTSIIPQDVMYCEFLKSKIVQAQAKTKDLLLINHQPDGHISTDDVGKSFQTAQNKVSLYSNEIKSHVDETERIGIYNDVVVENTDLNITKTDDTSVCDGNDDKIKSNNFKELECRNNKSNECSNTNPVTHNNMAQSVKIKTNLFLSDDSLLKSEFEPSYHNEQSTKIFQTHVDIMLKKRTQDNMIESTLQDICDGRHEDENIQVTDAMYTQIINNMNSLIQPTIPLNEEIEIAKSSVDSGVHQESNTQEIFYEYISKPKNIEENENTILEINNSSCNIFDIHMASKDKINETTLATCGNFNLFGEDVNESKSSNCQENASDYDEPLTAFESTDSNDDARFNLSVLISEEESEIFELAGLSNQIRPHKVYHPKYRKSKKRKFSTDLCSLFESKRLRKSKSLIDCPDDFTQVVNNISYVTAFEAWRNVNSAMKLSFYQIYKRCNTDLLHDSSDYRIPESKYLRIEELESPDINSLKNQSLNLITDEKGFGERSDRVIQNINISDDIVKLSAEILSDVKLNKQPLSPEEATPPCNKEKDDIFETIEKIVRNFFLNYDKFMLQDDKFRPRHINRIFSQIPGLYDTTFYVHHFNTTVVNVVQVGQPPVTAAAQNPVSCESRVTQVTDASPSQCSVDSSPQTISGSESPRNRTTQYTELKTVDISIPETNNFAVTDVSVKESSHKTLQIFENTDTEIDERQIIIPSQATENGTPKENIDMKQEIIDEDQLIMPNDLISDPPVQTLFTVQNSDMDQSIFEAKPENNDVTEKSNPIASAMSAAGITTCPDTSQTLVNILSQKIVHPQLVNTSANTLNFTKTTSVNTMSIQQALAQILPQQLNQHSSDNLSHNNLEPQVLHILQAKNTGGNQITLLENQPSVINTPNATQVLHIVHNKSSVGSNMSNGGAVPVSTFGGISLLESIPQNNQLLHIVNAAAAQNKANPGQLLKRVNLITGLPNNSEQKMVQLVCKSADGKALQLNAPHQRSMVLRLQPIDSTVQHKTEALTSPSETATTSNKDTVQPHEIKSRSVYEENYAKFIQNSANKPSILTEKSLGLPKFNQAFGKAVFNENSTNDEKGNESVVSNAQTSITTNPTNSTDNGTDINGANVDQRKQIDSSPSLIRKSNQNVPPTSMGQQIKQSVAPVNIQTMHGGVIYTRQIPVNIGGGQTINLITVPTTELIEDTTQKQTGDLKFITTEGEPPMLKIFSQNQISSVDPSGEENSQNITVTDNIQNQTQSQPVLTQMRIKLPMISKTPQVVPGGRVVRPSFFQIQRNVISGTNQPVYQQLVLTAAPHIGQQTVRLPQPQALRQVKVPSQSQPTETNMSSSTLEQLREFDMVLEQVKERSTVQPEAPANIYANINTSEIATETTVTLTGNLSAEHSHPVLYSLGTQALNVAYINRKTAVATPTTTTYVRSPDSTSVIDSPTSTQVTVNDSPGDVLQKQKIHSKSLKNKPKLSNIPSAPKVAPVPPKPTTQKPIEDEQTTQRILYILAEYKEQVENSPDKDKPAPRRRTNPPTSSGSSKRKKSGGSRKGRDSSPVNDDPSRTMGSEDSSCGTSQGDCTENCVADVHSPQESPRKVPRKLTFEQEPLLNRPVPPRNVFLADGQTIAVTRGAVGKPATAVLMPANYLLPVSMVKGGQQIAIVTNRGPKLLAVPGEAGQPNTLLLQRLIAPGGLKPVLTRPGVRHVRLPAAALHNLQHFNLAAATPDVNTTTVSSKDVVDCQTHPSWEERDCHQEVKTEESSESEAGDAWRIRQAAENRDYIYQDLPSQKERLTDRTVLDPMHDRYSPDMEADRIFDKMFDVSDSKKQYIQDPRDGQNFDLDCEDKSFHQVVAKKDGAGGSGYTVHHVAGAGGLRHLTHVSAAALRHKYAMLEHELRLQKSLSEECEDLGVDSPSASELFPEAELLFAASPAHEHAPPPDHPHAQHHHHHHHHAVHHHHAPSSLLAQPSIQPDIDDQTATDRLLPHERADHDHDGPHEHDHERHQLDDNISLGDVVEEVVPLDHEEFARAHPNTTFHSEPEETESFPVSTVKPRHIASAIFHAHPSPGTVLMAGPHAVISQVPPAELAHDAVKYVAGIEHIMRVLPDDQRHVATALPSVLVKDDGLARFDSMLTDSREIHLSNTAAAVVHPGNAAQVIRRVCYEDAERRDADAQFLMDDADQVIAGDDAKMVAEDSSRDATLGSMGGDADDDRSSPERHTELFWESNSASASESRRHVDFSESDSEKCCKSPSLDETNSTDSSGLGATMRLDSVIKEARRRERCASGDASSLEDTGHQPVRTYPPKRNFQLSETHDQERSTSGKTRAGERSPDSPEVRRRASGRGVVKRGCHCCNGSPAPSKPKKPRPKKPSNEAAPTNS